LISQGGRYEDGYQELQGLVLVWFCGSGADDRDGVKNFLRRPAMKNMLNKILYIFLIIASLVLGWGSIIRSFSGVSGWGYAQSCVVFGGSYSAPAANFFLNYAGYAM
jgi:hypothetical protein